jgi:glycosyltransferase involved in cell wall biosynthesis
MRENEPSRKSKIVPLVSVIIPTNNSDKTIEKCLESIKDQTYKIVEILVIDNYSSDNTLKISSKLGSKIFLHHGERTKAKNFGISESNGEFLLFVDSDMILQSHVIEECIRACSNNNIAGVIIPERSIGSGFWVKVRDFERRFYAYSKIESARFFMKKYVTQVGGFDEEIIAYEEATLPQKIADIGMSVNTRISSLILHDEEGFNLGNWLYKKRYYSATASLYSTRYRKYARMQMSILYRVNTLLANGNWKILLRHPILSTGIFVLKTLEFIFSRRIGSSNRRQSSIIKSLTD